MRRPSSAVAEDARAGDVGPWRLAAGLGVLRTAGASIDEPSSPRRCTFGGDGSGRCISEGDPGGGGVASGCPEEGPQGRRRRGGERRLRPPHGGGELCCRPLPPSVEGSLGQPRRALRLRALASLLGAGLNLLHDESSHFGAFDSYVGAAAGTQQDLRTSPVRGCLWPMGLPHPEAERPALLTMPSRRRQQRWQQTRLRRQVVNAVVVAYSS